MPARSYAIVGSGAVGGFYGARLQQAGFAVHFLCHRDYEHVARHGLRVESSDRILNVAPHHVYRSSHDMPPCDVVIVALKSTSNHLLPELLPPVLKPDGVVLTLQNGLGIEDDLARIAGPDRVLGGLCFIAANRIGPGVIRHIEYSDILLGEFRKDGRPGGLTPRLQELAADFSSARVPVKLAEDLVGARWHKLAWNIPFSGLCVVLRTTTDRLLADAATRRRIEQLMAEVVAAARACGREIADDFVRKMIDDTLRMPPYKPSMLLDLEAGRPLEVEAIFGNPVRMAQAAGATVPAMTELLQEVRQIDPGARAAPETSEPAP
jgi:2-dehydropantoate 2-reductase